MAGVDDIAAIAERSDGVDDIAARIDDIALRAHAVEAERLGQPFAPDAFGGAVVVRGHDRVGVRAIDEPALRQPGHAVDPAGIGEPGASAEAEETGEEQRAHRAGSRRELAVSLPSFAP